MHLFSHQILTLLILVPAGGALFMVAAPARLAPRWIALASALLALGLALATLSLFDRHPAAANPYAVRNLAHPAGVVQLVLRTKSPACPVHYAVGVDGLSLPFILLTTFIGAMSILASWTTDPVGKANFVRLLLLESAILAMFLVLDLCLFFVFFELSLIAIFLLIRLTDAPPKPTAGLRFAFFMLCVAAAILVAVVGIYRATGSFDLLALPKLCSERFGAAGSSFRLGKIFLGLLMGAFLIGLSAFPLHVALSGVQKEAPPPLGMILSALLPAMAGYGILRVGYPLFADAAKSLWLIFAISGVVTFVYGALCAMAEDDLKRKIALGLMSYLGLFVLGVAVMTPAALHGAMFLLVANGLIFALLNLLAGMLAQRLGHQDLSRLGGLAGAMPRFFGFAVVALLAGGALPGLCGFVGQFLVLAGVFQATTVPGGLVATGHARASQIYVLAVLACLGAVLVGCSAILTLHRIFFGARRDEPRDLPDINQRELAMLIPMTAMIFLLGILPGVVFFDFTRTTVDAIYGK